MSTFVERINEEMIKRGALTVSRAQTDAMHFFGQTLDWLHGLTGTVLHGLCVQPWPDYVRVRFKEHRQMRLAQAWLLAGQGQIKVRMCFLQVDFYPEGVTGEEQVTSFFRWWDGGE